MALNKKDAVALDRLIQSNGFTDVMGHLQGYTFSRIRGCEDDPWPEVHAAISYAATVTRKHLLCQGVEIPTCIHCGQPEKNHFIRNPGYPDIYPPGRWCPNGGSNQFESNADIGF